MFHLSRLLSILLLAIISLPVLSVSAEQVFSPSPAREDLDLQNGRKAGTTRDSYTEDFVNQIEWSVGSSFGNTFSYFRSSSTGERGAFGLLVSIARDLKNLFIFVAVIYLVISVLRILFSGAGDEDVKKWKGTILWTSIGIVIMQSAFVFVDTLFNKNISGQTSVYFLDKIVYPFVHLLEILASFAFLAMAFLAFYRIVTAAGDEEKVKSGKSMVISALIGFLIMKIPGFLVKSLYGEATCDAPLLFSICRIKDPELSGTLSVMTTIVNYANGFLALVIVILIIYAGWLVLASGGDEDKVKKAKHILLYIVIGVLLLVSSYIIFNFFVLKG